MQSENTIGWLSENQVIINLDESKVIVISKKKSDQGKEKIFVAKSLKLRGMKTTSQLFSNSHITNVSKYASKKLNALFRYISLLGDFIK